VKIMGKAQVRISGGDAVVHYDVIGEGPGLMLLHGTAADRGQWQPVVDAVRHRFTVVTPDFSGSGLTTDHGGPLTVGDLAAEAAAAAAGAGLGSYHLVGHSLGSAVATHLAGTWPGRVRSLFLHAGWVRTDARMDAELRFWLDLLARDGAGDKALFARALPLMAFGPAYWARTTPAENDSLVADLAGSIAPGAARQTEVDRLVDLAAALPRITAPTLVFGSAHDRLIDAGQQHRLVEGITGARYAEIDAGHGAPAEDPAGFVEAITGFLGTR
jgi:pimeloyl-ACP methyl ester carboxylesterase